MTYDKYLAEMTELDSNFDKLPGLILAAHEECLTATLGKIPLHKRRSMLAEMTRRIIRNTTDKFGEDGGKIT